MKKLSNLTDLKTKYDPDKIISAIDSNYLRKKTALINLLSINSCPLSNYLKDRQMSFFDSNNTQKNELIIEISETLYDAIYFMTLSKKDRTQTTQRMRSFAIELINSQMERIELIIDESLLVLPYSKNKESTQNNILEEVTEILKSIQSGLEVELSYWNSIPRAGYLSGLQVSMGEFFTRLNQIGMTQKDQITIVEQIFNEFKVDWEEGARENIKVSLQQPALEIYQKRKLHFNKIIGLEQNTSTKNFNTDLTKVFNIYRSQLRRF